VEINVAGNNKTYLSLYVKCPILLLPDVNQIWILSTDFFINSQYQTSRKFLPSWYIRTDGHDEAKRRFSRL